MKLHQIIFAGELKLLLRSRTQITALLLFIGLGAFSVYYGHSEIGKQQDRLRSVGDTLEKKKLQYLEAFKADTSTAAGKYAYEAAALPSLARFSYNFLASNPPAALAVLSLGQRDLYPYYYILNAQNLYAQTLKGDINNPFKLSAGNFDLAFVFVYLLPLLIIALSFDVLSLEQDQGTLSLLQTSSFPLKKIIAQKIRFRCLLVLLLVLVLSAAAFLACGPGLQLAQSLGWLLVLFAYTGLWFSILYLIISFKMNTSLNAISSIGVWICLLIVVPALINLLVAGGQKQQSSRLAGLMRSRNMPEKEEAMRGALNHFYSYYPALKPADTAKTPFFYFQGYSAFLMTEQLKSKVLVEELYHAVKERNRKVSYFNLISPAVHTQELLNALSGTDMDRELQFKQAIEKYHRQIFWFSNRALFANRLLTRADYADEPRFEFKPPTLSAGTLFLGLFQLLGSGICLLLWAGKNFSVAFKEDQ